MRTRTVQLASSLVVLSLLILACSGNSEKEASAGPGYPAWPVPPDARGVRNPLSDQVAAAKEGRTLFVQQCSMCHGTEGKGDGPDAQRFQPAPRDLRDRQVQRQTEGELYYKISVGRAPMPAFEPGLSDEQRWKLVSYIRTLRK